MSPGRASAALTICSPSLCAWALWTQVETAAQPLPGILWPACSSDQVTNDAHHGLPGETPAAARYLSTCGPVFELPISCTPFCDCANRNAAAPTGPLPPAPLDPDAAASAAAPPGGAAPVEPAAGGVTAAAAASGGAPVAAAAPSPGAATSGGGVQSAE